MSSGGGGYISGRPLVSRTGSGIYKPAHLSPNISSEWLYSSIDYGRFLSSVPGCHQFFSTYKNKSLAVHGPVYIKGHSNNKCFTYETTAMNAVNFLLRELTLTLSKSLKV